MLLAARAITHLADVLPASCSSIVRHGAVTVLCGRLLAIEYIDLAEQSLQALEKLSYEHPQVRPGMISHLGGQASMDGSCARCSADHCMVV